MERLIQCMADNVVSPLGLDSERDVPEQNGDEENQEYADDDEHSRRCEPRRIGEYLDVIRTASDELVAADARKDGVRTPVLRLEDDASRDFDAATEGETFENAAVGADIDREPCVRGFDQDESVVV